MRGIYIKDGMKGGFLAPSQDITKGILICVLQNLEYTSMQTVFQPAHTIRIPPHSAGLWTLCRGLDRFDQSTRQRRAKLDTITVQKDSQF